jgi:hypothetical protein
VKISSGMAIIAPIVSIVIIIIIDENNSFHFRPVFLLNFKFVVSLRGGGRGGE